VTRKAKIVTIIYLNFLVASYLYAEINSPSQFIKCANKYVNKSVYLEGEPLKIDDNYGNLVWKEPIETDDFDCSGFFSYCYNLRRHYASEEIIGFGEEIKWEDLKQGDFLGFIGEPGHVWFFESYDSEHCCPK